MKRNLEEDRKNQHHHLKIVKDPFARQPGHYSTLPEGFLTFRCELCGVECYIRRADSLKYLRQENTRPMRADGKMFYQKDGEWVLIYTLIS